jgi:hypothetical protein
MDTIETRGAAEVPGGRIGSGGEAKHCLTPGGDPERHPTIDNVNAVLAERLSPTEHICRRIAAMTGAPAALVAAIDCNLSGSASGSRPIGTALSRQR